MLAPSATANHAVRKQRLGIIAAELVLGRARQCEVARHLPRALALVEGTAKFLGVFAQAAAAVLFQVLQPCQPFAGDAFGVMHEAA